MGEVKRQEVHFDPVKTGYVCPKCGESLETLDGNGQQVLHGITRRGMTDGALSCPHCSTVCVPTIGSVAVDLDLKTLVGDADRTILLAGLQALHRERVAAWNAAVSVAIIRNEKQPDMEQFGIDDVAGMLRRVGAAPSAY